MRIFSFLPGLILTCVLSSNAFAACSGNALGTSRTLQIDPQKQLHIVGTEPSLGLRDKEVILTFDDGPIAGKTPRILAALKKECVKATFFYVGRMAKYQPGMVRQVVADGHTLAHHTHNHNRLPNYSINKASKLIDQGISTLQKIAYNDDSATPRVPFFRYPYLSHSKATDAMLRKKGLIAFGANIDSNDWKKSSADAVHDRIMAMLKKQGRGIILMHDIQSRTAKMLPRLLRSLKAGGYKVVHMVPAGTPLPSKEEPQVVAALDQSDIKLPQVEVLRAEVEQVSQSVNDEPAQSQPEQTIPPSRPEVILVDAAAQASKRYAPKPVLTQLAERNDQRRTGVIVSNLQHSANDTIVVSSGPAKAEPQPSTVAQEVVKPAPKRKIRKSRSKNRLVVLAGKTRKDRIKAGNWQLRRSQWILR